MTRQKSPYALCERYRVLRRNQHAGLAIDNDLEDPANSAGDDGGPADLSFEDHKAERLNTARYSQYASPAVQFGEGVALLPTNEVNCLGEAEIQCERVKRPLFGTVPHNRHAQGIDVPLDQRQGPQQDVHSLDRNQIADEQNIDIPIPWLHGCHVLHESGGNRIVHDPSDRCNIRKDFQQLFLQRVRDGCHRSARGQ